MPTPRLYHYTVWDSRAAFAGDPNAGRVWHGRTTDKAAALLVTAYVRRYPASGLVAAYRGREIGRPVFSDHGGSACGVASCRRCYAPEVFNDTNDPTPEPLLWEEALS